MGRLTLPTPIGKQPGWLDSSARRKVMRVGRRGSKTRFALIAAVAGHGSGPYGQKEMPGILEGWDVVWIAQDYPQLMTVVWREEIVPRFGELAEAKLNQNTPGPLVSIAGKGTLYLRSAEAIGSVRGVGKRLKGVIVDEAAWLDLEEALLDVILPALADNDGWLILMSTTNAGPDGNTAKRVPSYFNVICEEIRAGERGADWQEFTGTAYDNPAMSKSAIDELVAEYAPDSPKLRQEVYAELLRGGIGMALPEMDEAQHLVERFPVPAHWTQFGAFDWGFQHPYAFGWFAADEDGNVYLVDTLWGRHELPLEIIAKVRAAFPVERFRYSVVGADADQKHRARGETGPSIREQFIVGGIPLVIANTARVDGLANLQRYVTCKTPNGGATTPRFAMMDTEGNRRVLKCLQAMQIDPLDLEDALKVDADHRGEGGDDGYDMVRYGLMSRPLPALPLPASNVKQDHTAARIDFRTGKPRIETDPERALSAALGGVTGPTNPHRTVPGHHRIPRGR